MKTHRYLFQFAFTAAVISPAALQAQLEWTLNSPEAAARPKEELRVAGVASQWVANAPIPITNGLSQTTAVTDNNGLIYLIGGGLGAGPDARINQVLAYDPASDTWTRKADIPLPNGISAYGSAVQLDGFIYVFGGVTGSGGDVAVLDTAWIYGIDADAWFALANLPGGPRFGAAVAAINGKIIVAGGASDVALSSTFEYDPDTDTYAPKANLPAPLFRIHAAIVEETGEMHVFAGGFGGNNHLVYRTGSDTWSVSVPMPIGVTDPGVVLAQGKIWVLGAGIRGFVGIPQVFNLTTATWSPGPFMPNAIDNTSAALSGGKIFSEGGFDGVTSANPNLSLQLP